MQFYDNFLEQHVKGSVITHLNIVFGCVQYTCLLIQNNTPDISACQFNSQHWRLKVNTPKGDNLSAAPNVATNA